MGGGGRPPARPLPKIIIEEMKLKILGSPLPARVEEEEAGMEMVTLGPPVVERKKSRTPEEENQLKAKRQFREDLKVITTILVILLSLLPELLQVYVAMLIILLLAGAITGVKMFLVEKFGPPPPAG